MRPLGDDIQHATEADSAINGHANDIGHTVVFNDLCWERNKFREIAMTATKGSLSPQCYSQIKVDMTNHRGRPRGAARPVSFLAGALPMSQLPRLSNKDRQDASFAGLRISAARIPDLAGEFGVSTQTIRRDLKGDGRGGQSIAPTAAQWARPFGIEPAWNERFNVMTEERARIAALATGSCGTRRGPRHRCRLHDPPFFAPPPGRGAAQSIGGHQQFRRCHGAFGNSSIK